jgi:hypothetical protein
VIAGEKSGSPLPRVPIRNRRAPAIIQTIEDELKSPTTGK